MAIAWNVRVWHLLVTSRIHGQSNDGFALTKLILEVGHKCGRPFWDSQSEGVATNLFGSPLENVHHKPF
jgi:hypothetical protein